MRIWTREVCSREVKPTPRLHLMRGLKPPTSREKTGWGLQACRAGWSSTVAWTAGERRTTGQKGGEEAQEQLQEDGSTLFQERQTPVQQGASLA